MTQQADQIREHIERSFRVVYVNPVNGDIALPFTGTDACWWMQVKVRGDEGNEWVEVSSRWPVYAPRERRAAMCELLQRIENSLIQGKFEFDLDDDGEVRFCTTFRYGDAPVEEEHLRHLIGSNLATVRAHLSDAIKVAYQGADPCEVLHEEDDAPARGDLDAEFAGLLEELDLGLDAALLEELGIERPAEEGVEDDEPSGDAGQGADEGRAA